MIQDYLKAGYPVLSVKTHEPELTGETTGPQPTGGGQSGDKGGSSRPLSPPLRAARNLSSTSLGARR
jgi:hypothetical protein